MNNQNIFDAKIFYVLCARAIQRIGQGFPASDKEIQEFESTYHPSPEEIAFCNNEFDHIIESAFQAYAESDNVEDALIKMSSHQSSPRFLPFRNNTFLAAARNSKSNKISKELEGDIERIIDEDDTVIETDIE